MPNWNKLNLADEDKIKLIEVLLVVGSILVAFKFLPDSVVWVFLVFVVLAIILFITLKKGSKKNKFYNINALIASVCFSATLSVELGISVGVGLKTEVSQNIIDNGMLSGIIGILYFLLITYVLYSALKK